jgi:uncharacterized protein VirK/YbjX
MPLLIGWFVAGSQWLAGLTDSFATIQRAGRTLYPGTSRFHRWRRLRFCLRSLLFWHTTMVWLKRCSMSPLVGLVQLHPATLERMHRPFLHGRLSSRERLAASLDHQTLTQQRVPHLADRIAAEGRIAIARFSVGRESWCVSLESIGHFQREGDWTLCIRDASDRRVAS